MGLTNVDLYRIDGNVGSLSNVQTSALNGGPLAGARNRIINGDMRIDQRNAGAAVTTNGAFLSDRWKITNTTDGAFSAQRSTTVPNGFANSLYVTITTADASLTTTQQLFVGQSIEGFNGDDLNWGTASAKTITLSFQVRSSITGTFAGVLRNYAGDRSYVFTYVINAANTWETKTITITGDTTGTWSIDNSGWADVVFSLGAGPSRQTAAGIWTAGGPFTGTSGQVSLVSTLNATFYITGVQLEAGTVATPFERRSYGQELALCQRYYQKTNPDNVTRGGGLAGTIYSATNCVAYYTLPVTMRSAPTFTRGGTNDNWYIAGLAGNATGSTSGSTTSVNHAWMESLNLSNGGNGYQITYNGQLSLNSEL